MKKQTFNSFTSLDVSVNNWYEPHIWKQPKKNFQFSFPSLQFILLLLAQHLFIFFVHLSFIFQLFLSSTIFDIVFAFLSPGFSEQFCGGKRFPQKVNRSSEKVSLKMRYSSMLELCYIINESRTSLIPLLENYLPLTGNLISSHQSFCLPEHADHSFVVSLHQ